MGRCRPTTTKSGRLSCQHRRGAGHLVGDCFTVADLSAAALFYPVARPPEFPYPMVADHDLPERAREFLGSLAQRPGGKWVAAIYHRHRHSSAEHARR